MKKIKGKGMNEILEHHPEMLDETINKYIHAMASIHSINPDLFPRIPKMDIQKNPYAVIDQALDSVKLRIKKYPEDLTEFKLVVDWLDENKTKNPCEELVVVHGDFHPFNIIVDEEETFQILDWTGINISDFRRDLSFATGAISAGMRKNLTSLFSEKYEELTGRKTKNLEYFMILSSAWNLLRWYSGINNPTITGESEETMTFFKTVREYPLLMVELVKEECGIDIQQIRNYFS
jgi:aminoglycoside phosphotransferase (APT) family kinase protein